MKRMKILNKGQMKRMTSEPVFPSPNFGTTRAGRLSNLQIRPRLRGRRVPGSKPDSPEDPSRMGPIARQIICSGQTSSCWCGTEVWREGESGVVLVI
ncbi:hypothetical protein AVEN_227236-1 [Araneus ventricosus]|uniref:Uncharacterized protein n=1 Tax=Araneus ventricosus TaxID=182803 RepID=A0A4Y2IMI3_ARAVE|nr:hypothetical protein AVEN_227236-1 [Araneus ventricosus]